MADEERLQTGPGEKVYRKNSDIVTRKIAGDLFLVPIKGKLADMQRIFSVNAVGEFIWQSMDSQRSLNDIRDDLASNFTVDEDEAMADIEAFVSELLQADLITEKR